MRLETRAQILEAFRVMPFLTTEQISRFFPNNNQPTKRASAALKVLEKEKLLTGKNRLGAPKVWWLTKQGRDLLEVNQSYKRSDSIQLPHLLEIGDVYLDLLLAGGLTHFVPEPKERFMVGEQEKVYRPDAFAIWRGKPYLFEVQRSPKSTTAWAEKHGILEQLIHSGAWQRAFWHMGKPAIYRVPRIVILSPRQQEETIQAGSSIPFTIIRSMKEMVDK